MGRKVYIYGDGNEYYSAGDDYRSYSLCNWLIQYVSMIILWLDYLFKV